MEGRSALGDCPVCLTEMSNPKLLPCTHTLCLTCARTLAGMILITILMILIILILCILLIIRGLLSDEGCLQPVVRPCEGSHGWIPRFVRACMENLVDQFL